MDAPSQSQTVATLVNQEWALPGLVFHMAATEECVVDTWTPVRTHGRIK